MTPQPEPRSPRRRLWLRLVFGLSLALNLLVVGLVVGAMIRFGGKDGIRPPSPLGAVMYRELSRTDRQALRSDMRSAPADRINSRRAEAEAIGAALRAQPFDADALSTVLDARAKTRDNWQRAVQRSWLERVKKMRDADRAAYADRLQKALLSHHTHGKKR